MILATIELGRDGNTIMRQMDEADRIQKAAMDWARRTLIELMLVDPGDIVLCDEGPNNRTIVVKEREVYRQRVERYEEKVVVLGDWLCTAALSHGPKDWWTL